MKERDGDRRRLLGHPGSVVPQAVCDSDLRLTWCNRRFDELLRLDGDWSGRRLTEVTSFFDHDAESLIELLRSAKTGYSFAGECETRFHRYPSLHAHAQILPLGGTGDAAEVDGYIVCLRDSSREFRTNLESIYTGLLQASRLKDNDTGNHIERVNLYSQVMAEKIFSDGSWLEVTRDFVDTIAFLAAMHDVGKIGIPDDILNKNGPLEEWEWEIMKGHCLNGVYIISTYPDPMAVEIVRSHHERWDGSGYPYGLQGNMIPLSARIVSIADVYDALRSHRSYKESMSHAQTKELILLGRGTQFDPDLVDYFEAAEGRFEEIFDELTDPVQEDPRHLSAG